MSGSSSYLPYDFAGSWHSTVNPVPPSVTGFTFTPQYQPSVVLPARPPAVQLLAQATAGTAAGVSYMAADVANLTRHAMESAPRFEGTFPSIRKSYEANQATSGRVVAAGESAASRFVDRLDRSYASVGDSISNVAAGWAQGDPALTAKFNEGVEKGPTVVASSIAVAASQGKLGTSAYVGSVLGKTASFVAAKNPITVAREGSAFVDVATGRDNPRSYQIADEALRNYSRPFAPVGAAKAASLDMIMGHKANVAVAGMDLAAKLYRQHGLEKLAGKTDVSWADRVSAASPLFAEAVVDTLSVAAAKKFFPTFSYRGAAPARAVGQFLQEYGDAAQQGAQSDLVTAAQRNLDFARQK